MEDVMNPDCCREFESVGMTSDLVQHLEGAYLSVVKFSGGMVSSDIPCIEPDRVSFHKYWCWVASLISILGLYQLCPCHLDS